MTVFFYYEQGLLNPWLPEKKESKILFQLLKNILRIKNKIKIKKHSLILINIFVVGTIPV